jgi:hypothetical protein
MADHESTQAAMPAKPAPFTAGARPQTIPIRQVMPPTPPPAAQTDTPKPQPANPGK